MFLGSHHSSFPGVGTAAVLSLPESVKKGSCGYHGYEENDGFTCAANGMETVLG